MTTLSGAKIRAGLFGCALAVAAMASASTAVAQGREMTVKVPFTFHNGSETLPAGTYTIDLGSEHLLLLRGATKSGFTMTNPEYASTSAKSSKVIFRKYGDRYFLREVWVEGDSTGRRCVKSGAEKHAQIGEIAENATAPSDVELALNALPR